MANHVDNRIRVYRAVDWPAAAPPLQDIYRDAGALLRDVESRQPNKPRRTLDRLVVTANRRVSLTLRERDHAAATLRVHWTLLNERRLPDAVAKALDTGRFPDFTNDLVQRAAHQAGPGDCYEPRARDARGPRGQWIDLGSVLNNVRRYLPEPDIAAGVAIHWGEFPRRGGARHSVRLGSMATRDGAIRVHPVLDNPWVPRHVVEYVVFHELCHFIAPPLTSSEAGRLQEHRIHHSEFRRLESRYPHTREARRWIDDNLPRLLTHRPTAAH